MVRKRVKLRQLHRRILHPHKVNIRKLFILKSTLSKLLGLPRYFLVNMTKKELSEVLNEIKKHIK